MWTIFKVYWIYYNIASVLYFGFWLQCMWDVSSLTRNQTHTPCTGRQGPKNWTPRVCVFSHFRRIWLFVIPWTVAHQAPRPWNFPGKNTGVGSHALLQGIFLTQGWDPCLLICRRILYHWATWEAWTAGEVPTITFSLFIFFQHWRHIIFVT